MQDVNYGYMHARIGICPSVMFDARDGCATTEKGDDGGEER